MEESFVIFTAHISILRIEKALLVDIAIGGPRNPLKCIEIVVAVQT